MYFLVVYRLRRYLVAFRRYGVSYKVGVGKISSFLSLSVNMSKTVADMAKVTIND